jgi:hypothetical protein
MAECDRMHCRPRRHGGEAQGVAGSDGGFFCCRCRGQTPLGTLARRESRSAGTSLDHRRNKEMRSVQSCYRNVAFAGRVHRRAGRHGSPTLRRPQCSAASSAPRGEIENSSTPCFTRRARCSRGGVPATSRTGFRRSLHAGLEVANALRRRAVRAAFWAILSPSCQRWPPLGNIFGTSIEEVRFA